MKFYNPFEDCLIRHIMKKMRYQLMAPLNIQFLTCKFFKNQNVLNY